MKVNSNKKIISLPEQDHSSARCSFGQLKKLDHDHWSRNEDCKRRADGKYSCHSPGTFAIFFVSFIFDEISLNYKID